MELFKKTYRVTQEEWEWLSKNRVGNQLAGVWRQNVAKTSLFREIAEMLKSTPEEWKTEGSDWLDGWHGPQLALFGDKIVIRRSTIAVLQYKLEVHYFGAVFRFEDKFGPKHPAFHESDMGRLWMAMDYALGLIEARKNLQKIKGVAK